MHGNYANAPAPQLSRSCLALSFYRALQLTAQFFRRQLPAQSQLDAPVMCQRLLARALPLDGTRLPVRADSLPEWRQPHAHPFTRPSHLSLSVSLSPLSLLLVASAPQTGFGLGGLAAGLAKIGSVVAPAPILLTALLCFCCVACVYMCHARSDGIDLSLNILAQDPGGLKAWWNAPRALAARGPEHARRFVL